MVDQKLLEVGATHFLLALDEELQVDGETTMVAEQTASSLDLEENLTFVVDHPPASELPPLHGWLERGCPPLLQWFHRLDVVMAVDEHRGRFLPGVKPFAVRRWGTGRLEQADVLEAGVLEKVERELSGPPDIGRMVWLSRDRWDTHPLDQRFDDAPPLFVDIVGEGQLRHPCQANGRGKRRFGMTEQVEDIRARLEAISEELAEMALEQLREAVELGVPGDSRQQRTEEERRLSRARRAVEKAVAVLTD